MPLDFQYKSPTEIQNKSYFDMRYNKIKTIKVKLA